MAKPKKTSVDRRNFLKSAVAGAATIAAAPAVIRTTRLSSRSPPVGRGGPGQRRRSRPISSLRPRIGPARTSWWT